MAKGFKKVSRGYMEGNDYAGFGYFIEKEDNWGSREWWVYNMEDCTINEDGMIFTSCYATPVAKFDLLAEAKKWCMNNKRG